jgi:isocitrate lyase
MTLVHLFLIHRYKAGSVHYVTPNEDNQVQAERMKSLGIFSDVHTEIGQIIVAHVGTQVVADLLKPDRSALAEMIRKTSPSRACPAA